METMTTETGATLKFSNEGSDQLLLEVLRLLQAIEANTRK
jgi:hypothetical protein